MEVGRPPVRALQTVSVCLIVCVGGGARRADHGSAAMPSVTRVGVVTGRRRQEEGDKGQQQRKRTDHRRVRTCLLREHQCTGRSWWLQRGGQLQPPARKGALTLNSLPRARLAACVPATRQLLHADARESLVDTGGRTDVQWVSTCGGRMRRSSALLQHSSVITKTEQTKKGASGGRNSALLKPRVCSFFFSSPQHGA